MKQRMRDPEYKYRQLQIRFSKFENFVNTLLLEVEDEEARNKIRELYIVERDKVKERIS